MESSSSAGEEVDIALKEAAAPPAEAVAAPKTAVIIKEKHLVKQRNAESAKKAEEEMEKFRKEQEENKPLADPTAERLRLRALEVRATRNGLRRSR